MERAKEETRAAVEAASRAAKGFDMMAVVANYHVHRYSSSSLTIFVII